MPFTEMGKLWEDKIWVRGTEQELDFAHITLEMSGRYQMEMCVSS